MGKIATETEARTIGGQGTAETNRMCTKARAIALGCAVASSYSDNQLVQYEHLSPSIIDIIEIMYDGNMLGVTYGAPGAYVMSLSVSKSGKIIPISNDIQTTSGNLNKAIQSNIVNFYTDGPLSVSFPSTVYFKSDRSEVRGFYVNNNYVDVSTRKPPYTVNNIYYYASSGTGQRSPINISLAN